MPWEGKQLQPREIAARVDDFWDSLIKGTATFLGESRGFIGAYNLTKDSAGSVYGKDCGVPQIHISYAEPPTREQIREESTLRTESLDSVVYEPVVTESFRRARELYDQGWTRDGKPDKRRWQPWVAYTSGWATFPEFWIWEHKIGPWVPTGRYIQNALVGVANYHLLTKKDMNIVEALERAESLAEQFHVVLGRLGVKKSKGFPDGFVGWVEIPAKPTAPPEDGTGRRPIPNSGT